MKNMLFKAMAVLVGLAMSVSMVSCGDDDNDEPPVPENAVAQVEVRYDVSLGEDYYDLWDIEVTYTTPGGREATEEIEQDWSLTLRMNTADEIPSTYSISVVARPKNPLPALDADKVYTLSRDCYMKVTAKTDDGRKLLDITPVSAASSLNVKGDKADAIIKAERTVFSGSYTLPADL